MLILAHDCLLVILLWSLYEDSLLFCKSWHVDGVYNYLNTCLYALWNTLILDLMHNILFFSRFVFDEFIVEGGEYGHKVDWTLTNRVVERMNMINVYLRGRACIESVMRSFWVLWAFCVFELFLVLLCHFGLAYHFSCLLLALQLFLLVHDILELFDLLAVLHGVLYSNFKICAFCFQCSHQERDWETMWSVPWFDMWWAIDIPRFKFESRIFC
jgi:hypothetical protein